VPPTRRAVHYVLFVAKRDALRQLLPGLTQRDQGPVQRHQHGAHAGGEEAGAGADRHHGLAGEPPKHATSFLENHARLQ
jgi:hypothetical protein